MKIIKDLSLNEQKPSVKEADLWQNFKAGDRAALGVIFHDHYEALLLYGMNMVAREEVVKDAIQDLFLKLWRSRETLGVVEVIKPYLLKSLRHHLADEMKKTTRQNGLEQVLRQEQEADVAFSHEDFLIRQHNLEVTEERLAQALTKLTRRQREVVFLRFSIGLSHEKIVEVTEINIQSIRNLLYQALKILKENLLSTPLKSGAGH